MPRKPASRCSQPGCDKKTKPGYSRCSEHQSKARKISDRKRDNASTRGYGHKWRKSRSDYLLRNPLCHDCLNNGLITAASVVDHIKPHRGNQHLFWDVTNWQPLCEACHNKKTSREDGGFGRRGMGSQKS